MIASDEERTSLLKEETALMKQLEASANDSKNSSEIAARLTKVLILIRTISLSLSVCLDYCLWKKREMQFGMYVDACDIIGYICGFVAAYYCMLLYIVVVCCCVMYDV